jgi:ABC-type transport system involved in multi-copper enzyme maturation permease subunit
MEKETKKNRIHNKNMCLFALNIYLRLNFSTINHFAFFFFVFPFLVYFVFSLQFLFLLFSSYSRYIFTIVSYLIGVFIFATIVGQVGNVITNRNANRLEFERLLDGAKTYMRHHKV